MTTITPETLEAAVEFDSPFRLTPQDGGTSAYLVRSLHGLHAPDVTAEGDGGLYVEGNGWTPVDGHSGQHGYSGPIMHPSETLSGGMARRVVEEGGVYILVEVRDTDGTYPDGDPNGWALMRYTGDAL